MTTVIFEVRLGEVEGEGEVDGEVELELELGWRRGKGEARRW